VAQKHPNPSVLRVVAVGGESKTLAVFE